MEQVREKCPSLYAMLDVTNRALAALKNAVTEKKAGSAIRVVFQGFGRGGPWLGLALDEPVDGDQKLEKNGLLFLVDPEVASWVPKGERIRIDYNPLW